jgi:hypothetical protein
VKQRACRRRIGVFAARALAGILTFACAIVRMSAFGAYITIFSIFLPPNTQNIDYKLQTAAETQTNLNFDRIFPYRFFCCKDNAFFAIMCLIQKKN